MDVDVAPEDAPRPDPGEDASDLPLEDLGDDEGAGMTVWVTVAEAAEKAGLNTSTVRQWYRSGHLPTQRAEGEHGAFLVPLQSVLALANKADETGDDLGAELVDLNAKYWSTETEAAREDAAKALAEAEEARTEMARLTAAVAAAEAAAARAGDELAAARDEAGAARAEATDALAEAASARAELAAATDQLEFLRSQLAETAEESRATKLELEQAKTEHQEVQKLLDESEDELVALEDAKAGMQAELDELRMLSGRAGSITDNSWLDMQTPAYQSPVRKQARLGSDVPTPTGEAEDEGHGMAAPMRTKGLANLLSQTVADGGSAPGADADADLADESDPDEEESVPAQPAVVFPGYGENEDDLLPEPEKKRRRH